jgi:hypothetical protein
MTLASFHAAFEGFLQGQGAEAGEGVSVEEFARVLAEEMVAGRA